jgi:hypothetical protein
MKATPSLDEGILNDILTVLTVPNNHICRAKKTPLITLNKLLKGVNVSVLSTQDKVSVLVLRCFRQSAQLRGGVLMGLRFRRHLALRVMRQCSLP